MKVNIRNLFKGILVAASIFAIAACSSDDDDSGESEKPISQVVINGGSAKDDGTYEIAQNGTVTLTCETAGAAIKYAFSDTEITTANIDKAKFKNVGDSGKVTIEKDCTLYAYAELNGRKSALTSRKFKVLPVPSKPEFTASAEAKDGLYPYGTTVSIASTSAVAGDTVKIFYSTTTELTASNAATAGTEYTSAAVIKIEKPLKLSAIAQGNNGWSQVTTVDYDCTVTYEEGAFDFDGNIAKAVDAINEKAGASFGDGLDLTGYVTLAANTVSAGKPYIYIQDKNAGIQIYGIDTSAATYAVGDFVTVQGAKAGEVYGTSGVTEVTSFGSVSKDDSKATRKIYFKKIPSYCVDFREYIGVGTLLRGFRAKTSDHTSNYDNIYTAGASPAAVTNAEKINLGPVVYASGKYQFSVWTQLDADDSVLALDELPVKTVTATTSAEAVNGYYAAGTTVTFACETTGADIYYSTTEFAQTDFDIANPDSSKFTKVTGPYTVTDDVVLYTIAVKGNDKSPVKMFEYLTPFDTTLVALDSANNYALDGNLAALAAAKPTDASDTAKYSGYIVAYNGTSNKQFLVQDKNAGVYIYNVTPPTNARVGSKIEFTVKKGSVYNGLYEVTGADITVVEAKSTNKIYYINITGKEDFTSYCTGQLCGLSGKAAEYKDAKATVYALAGDDGKAKSFFGYVYNRTPKTGDATIQLAEMFHKDDGTVPYPADYLFAPEFNVEAGAVEAGTKVTITCAGTDAAITYAFVKKDAAAPADTDYVAYTAPVELTEDGTLYAKSTVGTKSKTVSAAYTIKASNAVVIDLANSNSLYLKDNATVSTDSNNRKTLEITDSNGTKITLANAYKANTHVGTMVKDNSCKYTFKPATGKTISSIKFDWNINSKKKGNAVFTGTTDTESTPSTEFTTVTLNSDGEFVLEATKTAYCKTITITYAD